MEEDEERGEEDVHHGGQGSSGGAETPQSRLLEAQENQLGKNLPHMCVKINSTVLLLSREVITLE